jgi:6-phosphogluconolactonase
VLLGCAASVRAAEGDPFPPDDLANETLVFAASRPKDGKHGVHSFWLQTKNLPVSQNITLVPIGLAAETPHPAAVAVDETRRLVIVLNDVEELGGVAGGAVSVFAVQAKTGQLALLDQRSSMGAQPCQMALDAGAGRALVANCGDGKIVVFPLADDGKLGEPASVLEGSGADCVSFDPAHRFAFVCDSEANTIQAYRYDAATGALTANGAAVGSLEGAGVRRLAFRPDGKFAYALHGSSSTVTAFSYEAASGTLAEIESVATVPPYYDGPNTAAELGMHPDGKFLYVSNDGHNSVVLFTVGEADGKPAFVEEQGVGGKNPAHFGIQPSAKHLTIANRDSDALLVCRIDAGNGRLKPSGVFASIPAPTAVQFLPPAK